jgi:MFS family permease
MLTTTFRDPKERGRAFGIFGSIAGSGAALGLLLGGVLTEYATWRWCLYVNVVFAVLGVIGALVFMAKPPKADRPRIDVAGVLTITVGLVGIVYGFSNAETNGWDDPLTIVMLAAGVVLVAAFVVIETRVAHPLLPLRVVLDRDRGGSYIAIGLVAIGMFGIFLFLTYYLEQTLGFTSLQTGLAFLPMPLSIIVSSTQIGGRLLPRVGPKVLVFAGGLVAATGLLLLLRTDLDSTYAGTVLPALVVIGLGMGTIFSSAINTATTGVARADAGVASATVNTMQQIGGSIGTALLSTIFADVVKDRLADLSAAPTKLQQAQAVLDGYHVAFGISAGVLVLVALVGGLLINRQSVRLAKLEHAAATATGSIACRAGRPRVLGATRLVRARRGPCAARRVRGGDPCHCGTTGPLLHDVGRVTRGTSRTLHVQGATWPTSYDDDGVVRQRPTDPRAHRGSCPSGTPTVPGAESRGTERRAVAQCCGSPRRRQGSPLRWAPWPPS